MKKPFIFYTIALNQINQDYAKMMINSFRKFHPEDKYPLLVYGMEDYKKLKHIKQEYKNIDDHLFRLTPLFTRELLKEYELVVRLDADQIIMGELNYIVDQRKNYDIGGVLNINRIDPLRYTPCSGWGIPPNEYMNIGMTAFTSERAANHLWELCNSKYFWRLQYREQDLFNALAVYGGYRTKCFDNYDVENKYYAWHGLVAKGEGTRMKLVKDTGDKYKVVLPRGPDNYPDHDMEIKIFHWAGGAYETKFNYEIYFKDNMIDYIKWLISDSKEKYGQTKEKGNKTI